jgi:hypothetical protein
LHRTTEASITRSDIESRGQGSGSRKEASLRRIGIAIVLVTTSVVLLAPQALAQYPPSKPAPSTQPDAGAVAFTGANITIGLVIVIALVVVGTTLLLAGRRRKVGAPK